MRKSLESRLPNLLSYAALALTLIGLLASLLAPGRWMALVFAALFIYLLKYRQIPVAQPGTARPPSTTIPTRESDTYRSLEWKNMIFRSESEIKIAKTLDHRGIFFIPPARARLNAGSKGRQTRELDFVICHEGKWGILEVDGPFHVAQADAERDAMLRTHGITSIQRFPSLRCFQQPQAVIDEFLFELEEGS